MGKKIYVFWLLFLYISDWINRGKNTLSQHKTLGKKPEAAAKLCV